jgi:hypothetical protein
MKAILEVEFTIDEGYGFSKEDVEKALFANLELRGFPMVERTPRGNITMRIKDMRLLELKKSETPES